MNTDPNPQGKGLVPVMNDVASSRAKIKVPPKKIDQIAGELSVKQKGCWRIVNEGWK